MDKKADGLIFPLCRWLALVSSWPQRNSIFCPDEIVQMNSLQSLLLDGCPADEVGLRLMSLVLVSSCN